MKVVTSLTVGNMGHSVGTLIFDLLKMKDEKVLIIKHSM